jgi:hypothetical protein
MTTFSSIELAFKLYVPVDQYIALTLLGSLQNPIFFFNQWYLDNFQLAGLNLSMVKTDVLCLGFPIKATLMFWLIKV